MNLQPAKGRFYKLVSKEGKHLFCREVFPPLASTFLFFTKVTQPATLPHEKEKATAQSPPTHRQLNYRSNLEFWEKDLAGRRSVSGVRKSDLGGRKSGLDVGPRARNGRAAGVERACRGRGTVVPRAWNARVAGAKRSCRGRDTTAECYTETAESPAQTAGCLMQFSKAVLGDTNAPSN